MYITYFIMLNCIHTPDRRDSAHRLTGGFPHGSFSISLAQKKKVKDGKMVYLYNIVKDYILKANHPKN